MVTIQQRPVEDGYYFEIADFRDYVEALQARGIEPPKARYRFFVSHADERKLRESQNDWRQELEAFYRLGPSSGIPCQFTAQESSGKTNLKGTHGQETNDD